MAGAWVLEGAVLAPWEQGQKPRVRGKLLYSETSAAPCQVSGPALVPSLPSASSLQKESSTDGGVLGPGGGCPGANSRSLRAQDRPSRAQVGLVRCPVAPAFRSSGHKVGLRGKTLCSFIPPASHGADGSPTSTAHGPRRKPSSHVESGPPGVRPERLARRPRAKVL